ncbi:MAG: hypothetical protein AAB974_01415 [Patescibacteria group bacterium]
MVSVPVIAVVSALVVFVAVWPAMAAAPTGTLTGSVQTIAVGATAAINTLTYTETDPAEVTAANDLRIRIPTTVNAIWDVTDTTATLSGQAATSTSVTVSFTNSNKVLVLNATDRFSPSSTLVIAGLNISGTEYETAAAALEFSIDGGATYGTANANTAITVTPAALTSTNVEPATLVAGRSSTSTITFTQLVSSTTSTGKIAVTFPSGFILTSVGALDGTCSTMDGSFATAVSGQTVTITRSGGTVEPPGAQTCAIGNVINPGAGTAGTYTIETQDAAGASQTAAVDAAVSADTFTAGSMTPVNVEPQTLTRGLVGTVDVSFTTQSTIPVNGKIVVTFPTAFDVSQANNGTCATMDGSFATAVSGQVVTITRSAGGVQAAAAENCTIANVKNPTSSGSGGTYQVKTTTAADATLEENTAVAADTFSAPAGAGSGGGDLTPPGPVTGVSITLGADAHSAILVWTNPTDADLASVRILRTTVSGTFGTALTQALVSTYTDVGLTVGVTYYYTFQPVDATGNVRVDTTEYALIATPGAVAPAPSTPTSTPEAAPSTPPSSAPVTFPAGVAAADVVRGSAAAVYFVSADGKRHVFPSQTVFLSWYPDFSAVKIVADSALAVLPLGKNVTMRPGTYLVKIISDPKVYAVEPGGIIRWIPSEETARTLYGNAWATRVQDVDPILFADYTEGDMVLVTALPAGMVASDGSGGYWWMVRDAFGTSRRSVSAAALVLQRFPGSFAVPSLASLPSVVGSAITSFEAGLALPY